MIGRIGRRIRATLFAFGRDDKGVVTAEWVALAGAVLVGAITVGWLVLNQLQQPGSTIGNQVTTCESIAASTQGSTTGCP